jgi:predicted phosphodiesterase
MLLHILGDMHLEFGGSNIATPEADVVVLAGDIDVGDRGLNWIRSHFGDRSVIYVLGNHEYYRHALPELTDRLRQETVGSSIHLLENSVVELSGFNFLGCTLWTDFAVLGAPEDAMKIAEEMMNDFRIIRHSGEHRVLRARDTATLHHESLAWLKREVARHDPARTVIVTHHAPSPRSEAPIHRNGPLNPAFASNLDAFVEACRVPLWIHGHTHFNVDYLLGSTRVLSNQRGYPGQPCDGFNPGLVVTL